MPATHRGLVITQATVPAAAPIITFARLLRSEILLWVRMRGWELEVRAENASCATMSRAPRPAVTGTSLSVPGIGPQQNLRLELGVAEVVATPRRPHSCGQSKYKANAGRSNPTDVVNFLLHLQAYSTCSLLTHKSTSEPLVESSYPLSFQHVQNNLPCGSLS